MRQNVIFLDFDGVLNSIRTIAADNNVVNASKVKHARLVGNTIRSGFDPVAVALIRKVAMLSDAGIVISSAWRISISLEDIRAIFREEFGWDDVAQRIIGVTPRPETNNRGDEIQKWIDSYTKGIRNFNYLIIDDGYTFLSNQMEHLVQTDPYEGFIYKDYLKALEILGVDHDDEELL